MAGRRTVAKLLWVVAAAGCGRVGFDDESGTGMGPIVAIAPTIEANAECGVPVTAPVDVPVTNTGDEPLTIFGATADGGFTIVSSFPITIPPGASADLAIRPPAAVIGTDLAGDRRTGQLVIETNAAVEPAPVELRVTVIGANIEIVDGLASPITMLTFAGASGLCPTPISGVVRNTGNQPATVAFTDGSGFVVDFVAAELAAGAAKPIDFRSVTTGPCAQVGTVTYQVTGAACTSTPTVLQASLDIQGTSSCSCS